MNKTVKWTMEIEVPFSVEELVQPALWHYARETARALKDYDAPVNVSLWSDMGETIEFTEDNLCL